MSLTKGPDYNKIFFILIFILIQGIFYFGLNILGFHRNVLREIKAEFIVLFILMFHEGIYRHKSYLIWEELRKTLRVFTLFFLISLVMKIAGGQYNSNFLFLNFFNSIFNLIFTIFLVKLNRKYFYKFLKKDLVIIGVGDLAKKLSTIVDENSFTMYNIKGYVQFRDDIDIKIDKKKYLGKCHEISNCIFDNVDEIIVAIENVNEEEMTYIVNKLDGKVNKIKYIPDINGLFTFNSEVEDYDGIMLITAGQYIRSFNRRLVKRLIDIIGGCVGAFLLIPLTIYVWLKTDKEERKNGIFFTQDRVGKNGKTIKIYKYRSMVVNAEDILFQMLEENEEIREEYEKSKKIKNDPRVTEIGSFLRKTSLDEFPQLLNVLKGEMSLIGPRPYLHREIEDMGESYNKIIKFKPAITGMWQVSGRNDIDFNGRLILDEYYFRNWSLWVDIVILIKTIKQVIGRKGAY